MAAPQQSPPILHVHTPIWRSPAFRGLRGEDIQFKMDALQPTGSFKLRGVGALCIEAAAAGAERFVCASGGNAGLAVAYAAQALGLSAQVVVPESTSPEARRALQAHGASVEVYGESFDEAEGRARALCDASGGVYIHPFDDPRLWTGHASLVDEAVADGANFDVVITSVGGGGLLLGILEGLARNGLGYVPVIAVETEGAASLNASLAAGAPITLPEIRSIATSLGARRVADAAFAAARAPSPVRSVVVTDRAALEGCLRFAEVFRVLVEPASGAAIAATALLAGTGGFERPLVEVCGGVGVSLERLIAWRDRLEDEPASARG